MKRKVHRAFVEEVRHQSDGSTAFVGVCHATGAVCRTHAWRESEPAGPSDQRDLSAMHTAVKQLQIFGDCDAEHVL